MPDLGLDYSGGGFDPTMGGYAGSGGSGGDPSMGSYSMGGLGGMWGGGGGGNGYFSFGGGNPYGGSGGGGMNPYQMGAMGMGLGSALGGLGAGIYGMMNQPNVPNYGNATAGDYTTNMNDLNTLIGQAQNLTVPAWQSKNLSSNMDNLAATHGLSGMNAASLGSVGQSNLNAQWGQARMQLLQQLLGQKSGMLQNQRMQDMMQQEAQAQLSMMRYNALMGDATGMGSLAGKIVGGIGGMMGSMIPGGNSIAGVGGGGPTG